MTESVEISFTIETPHREIEFRLNDRYGVSDVLDGIGEFLSDATGIQDWKAKNEWLIARRQLEDATKQYEEWIQQVSARADRSIDQSVTAQRLKRVWDHLEQSEQPHFYVTGAEHRHHIIKSLDHGPAEVSHLNWALVSDQRILVDDEADQWDIQYERIVDLSINEREMQYESGETEFRAT